MQFQVPKFIEREAAIAFGLSFKKLAVAGGLGLGLFALKYMMSQVLWILTIIVVGAAFFALSFIKIGGHSLYALLINSFLFVGSARTYIWKQKQGNTPMKIVKKEVKQETKEEKPLLKITPRSRLGGLQARIDLGGSVETE